VRVATEHFKTNPKMKPMPKPTPHFATRPDDEQSRGSARCKPIFICRLSQFAAGRECKTDHGARVKRARKKFSPSSDSSIGRARQIAILDKNVWINTRGRGRRDCSIEISSGTKQRQYCFPCNMYPEKK
jgi:hypothetical protein